MQDLISSTILQFHYYSFIFDTLELTHELLTERSIVFEGSKNFGGVSWPISAARWKSDDSNFNECFSTRHSSVC